MSLMIKYLVLFLLLAANLANASGVMFCAGGVTAAAGSSCSGDMSDGDNESFEKGAGQFCTTDWTETDPDGVVSTYDNTNAHTGSYAAKFTADNDDANEPENKLYIDIGGTDTDIYIRFYFWTPADVVNYGAIYPLTIGDDVSETNGTVYLQYARNAASYQLKPRSVTANPAEYFELAVSTKYRIEMHVITNSASCNVKVFDASGNAVLTSNGGADYDLGFTSGAANMQYFIFKASTTDSTARTWYIDDVVIDTDGSDYIGAE